MLRILIPALLMAAPVMAQFAPSPADRLRALTAPPATDLYGSEKSADRARIEAEAEALFGPDRDAAIALFTAPDCADCAQAEAELAALTARLGLRHRIIALDDDTRPMFERLTFDTLPAYVLPDMLIRGQMPAFVLEGYLTGTR